MKTKRRFKLTARPARWAVLVYLLTAILTGSLVFYQDQLRRQAERAVFQDVAVHHAHALQLQIDRALSVTTALAALVRQSGGAIPDFDVLATELLGDYPTIKGLQLAPDGIVRRIVPLGNQLTLQGKDLFQDPVEGPDAALARDSGQITLSGPFSLPDGTTGLIGRQPVFTAQREGPRFWGFVSASIDLDKILHAAGLHDLTTEKFAFELTRRTPQSPDPQVIATSITTLVSDPVASALQFANTEWSLRIAPAHGWGQSVHLSIFVAIALLVSALTGYLVQLLIELRAHRRDLETRILGRTREINAAQEKLKATLEAIPDVLSEIDRDGHYKDFHAPPDSIFATEPTPIMGMAIEQHLPAHAAKAVRAALAQTMRTGHPTSGEFSIQQPMALRWFEITLSPKRRADDEAPSFIMLTRDITERKQQEERLHRLLTENQTILRNAVVGIIHVRQQTIISCNRRSEEIMGYAPGELAGRSTRCIYDSDDAFHRSGLSAYNTIRTGASFNEEILLSRKDGSKFWGAMTASAIDPAKPHDGSIWILADITERKRSKEQMLRLNEKLEERVALRTEELLNAKDEAERANLSKSEFLSSMSHELRTPLNAILGFSQLLKGDPVTPLNGEQTECVDEILRAGSHLLVLINEVLDLARIESGHLELSPETVDLRALFNECISLVRPQATARQLHIECHAHEPASIHVDRLRLRQMLLNLLSNAIKYNRTGGRIELESTAVAETIRISVRDTGIGIPSEFFPLLFRPFERHGSSSRHVEGTGIGLALCKRLVEAMGGAIAVESEPGVGSVFHVDLPLAQAIELQPLPRNDAEQISLPATDRCVPQRILLYVEDNPANLRLVEKIVARHRGLHLVAAGSAEVGIELAMSFLPDLILMDLGLPGIGGLEAMHRLKNNSRMKHVPIIALSANAMPDEITSACSAGFDDYLTKPLDIPRFEVMLSELMQHGG